MSDTTWTPAYDRWRHGGWYVTNVRYPSGACGCVSRNYADRKWRIVCDDREGSFPGGPNDHTYPNRDAAARAERELATAPVPVLCPDCGEPIEQHPSGSWSHVGLPNGCWRVSMDGPNEQD